MASIDSRLVEIERQLRQLSTEKRQLLARREQCAQLRKQCMPSSAGGAQQDATHQWTRTGKLMTQKSTIEN
jgi:hypothetical protein